MKIPPLVTVLSATFLKCTSLESVELPKNLKTIDRYAFSGCTKLASIEIPKTVTSIGTVAFYDCISLKTVKIPASVTSLGQWAFESSGLYSIYFYGDAPKAYSETDSQHRSLNRRTKVYYLEGRNGWNSSWGGYSCTTFELAEISTGKCNDDIDWTLYEEGIFKISGSGDMPDYNDTDNLPPWNDIKDSIYVLEFDDEITSIGNNSFSDCSELVTLYIPDSVTSIGNNAFYGCTSISSIVLPEFLTDIGDNAFGGCEKLTTIEFPRFVTNIGSGAFYNTGIVSAYFQGNAPTVSSASSEAPSFPTDTKMYYRKGRTDWTPDAWNGYTTDTFGTEIIAFGKCGTDAYWDFDSEGLLEIYGKGAMSDYTAYNKVPWNGYRQSVKTVTVGDKITYIGDWVFAASTLTSVKIPDSVTEIGDRAFDSCTSLTSIKIPSSVAVLGECALCSCSSLKTITVDDNNENFTAENGVLFNKNKTELIVCAAGVTFTEYAIPDSVTDIDGFAFAFCTSLTSVTIPYSVSVIKNNTFYNCSELLSITIPNTVTAINDSAFGGCSKLAAVIFEKDSIITSIGDYAFKGCSSLTSVTFPDSLTKIGISAFENSGLKKAYFRGNAPTVEIASSKSCSLPADSTLYYRKGRKNWVSPTWNGYNTETYDTEIIATGICGENAVWDLDIEGVLSVYGSGDMYDFDTENLPQWDSYKNTVTAISFGSKITSIGNNAFKGFISLSEITVPDNILKIGTETFGSCSSLKTINIDENNEKYSSEDGILFNKDKTVLIRCPQAAEINKYTVPSTVLTVSEKAFDSCPNISEITVPSTVTGIGNGAFASCTSLTTVIFEEKAKLSQINGSLFKNCKSLSLIEIPESVKTIEEYAFADCSSLTEITVPKSVTTIGNNAFERCTSLRTVTFEDSALTEISDYTFSDCTSLQAVAFNGTYVLSKVGNYAFSNCISLIYINIPNCVTSIGNFAFINCILLSEIKMPNIVKTIGESAFYNCKKLTEITFPNFITSIGGNAFVNTSLRYADFNGDAPTVEAADSQTPSFPSDVYISYRNGRKNWNAPKWNGYNTTTYGTKVITNGMCGPTATYEIDEFGTFTIAGYGDMYTYADTTDTYPRPDWTKQQDLITNIVVGSEITSIGRSAFLKHTTVRSVTFEANSKIRFIAWSAFNGCTNLSSIRIPKNVQSIAIKAFYGCTSLTSINIPDNVITIGGGAFANSGVTTAYFYGDTPRIDDWYYGKSFRSDVTLYYVYGKSGWESPTWNDYNTQTFVPNIASGKCGNDITWILHTNGTLELSGSGAMYDYSPSNIPWIEYRSSILSVDISENITSIGNNAFYLCQNMLTANIPSTVSSIGKNAFRFCSSLTSAALPVSLSTLKEYAFSGCSSLTSVSISASVSSIGDYAFGDCSSLEEISVSTDNTYYCSQNGILFDKNKTELIKCPAKTSLTYYAIPSTVNIIADEAFRECNSLKSVEIPESVTTINKASFINCKNLRDVYFFGNAPSIASEEDNTPSFDKENVIIYILRNKTGWDSQSWNGYDIRYFVPKASKDIDGDGKVNILDGILMKKAIDTFKNNNTPELDDLRKYDINGDGLIDIKDLECIVYCILST